MRVGILTQYYPPEMGAPQARLSHLAGEFVRRGHEVVVLTAMPNYPRGRIFPGYRGFLRRETRDGVPVIRCWLYPAQSARLLPRLASYFSFVFSSLAVGLFCLGRLDYLLTESPPLFLGITGWVLKLRTRARWIFNVSDLWPESAVRLGAVSEGLGLKLAQALEAFCYRNAWLVTGQSQEILASIRGRFPSVSLYHLSNGVDTELFSPESRSETVRARILDGAVEKGACVAIYAGLHGIAQGLEQILEAASRVRDVDGLVFVFVGDGPEKERLMARSRELDLPRVHFVEALPREEMPALLASADIALVPLGVPLPGAVPSKIYEAMGVSVPILLVAQGEAAALVSGSGAGRVVAPGDIDGIAAALRELFSSADRRAELGRAGRAAALRDFDRRNIADGFIRHLESLGTC